jgi:DNA-binding NtrC family response regulator
VPEKVSILIVDDDEEALETLSDLLQEKGFYTETAKTGKEALAKAEERFFNVVLLDIKLPDITGIEVLQALAGKHLSTMTIMMTAHATVQNAVDANNLGASAYIMKPIDQEKLLLAIKECLKKQEIFNLRISQGMRKIPVSISLSSSIIQQIDQEATRQRRTRSEYIELHFETYFFKETLQKKMVDSETPYLFKDRKNYK